jgi:hypothetical protein
MWVIGLQVGVSTTFVVPWSVDTATLTPTGMTVGVDQQRHELSLEVCAQFPRGLESRQLESRPKKGARKEQDWLLKCLQGERACPLAA